MVKLKLTNNAEYLWTKKKEKKKKQKKKHNYSF